MSISLVARTNYPNLLNNGTDTFNLSVRATPGNTLVVVISENLPDAVTAFIHDDVGDVFVNVNGASFTPSGNSLATTDIWYCIGCGAATSISFLCDSSPIIWVYELSGTDIRFANQGTNGIDNSGPSTNLTPGPTVGGQQAIFTDATAQTFGYAVSAVTFREGTGSPQFYADVAVCQSQPISVNGSWQLDVVSGDSRFSNLGAAWLLNASPPPPPPPTPCAAIDANGNPINGVLVADLDLFIIPAAALYTQLVPFANISLNESSAQGRKQIILDFNDSEGLYVRDMGTIFTWGLISGTILDVWQPSIVPMDADVYDRLSYHFTMKSLGIIGWGHAREMNIPFASSTDLTLLLSFGTGANPATISLTIPNSGGVETKTKVTLPPNKFKLVECFLSSSQPFKVWGSDLEMKIRSWGSEGPYQIVRPVSG